MQHRMAHHGDLSQEADICRDTISTKRAMSMPNIVDHADLSGCQIR